MKNNHVENTQSRMGASSGEPAPSAVYVEMHCHSTHSDGALTPQQLAKKLSQKGAVYAALTDHNTIEGLPSFKRALAKYGIGFISGVEITTQHKEHIIHLLAYGFDMENPELNALWDEKDTSPAAVNAGSMIYRAPGEIIDIVHRAGGIVVLAHPFQTEPNAQVVKQIAAELKEEGLDGIEAIYRETPKELEGELLKIADEYELLVTAGTDYHKLRDDGPGKMVAENQWKAIRNALLKASYTVQKTSSRAKPFAKKKRRHWSAFMRNIILPAVLTMALFIIALTVFLIPYFEDTLIERKRENIRQLTQVAWGVLNEATEEVENGEITLEQAQTLAKNRISAMRYGPENKDYFWIQDSTPRILMHPYRTDLNNQDVSDFQDAQGTRIFVEFADLVEEQGEGYISYVWQWKDETERLEPKESYIREFEPWGWIIGTGIYVNDVQAEINTLRSYIVQISAAVLFIVLVLLLYLIKNGTMIEKSRSEAEKKLIESTERYRALSEAATEGALFVYNGRCRYANAVMYELLDCAPDKIELLDLYDVFPNNEANKKWLEYLSVSHEKETSDTINGVLRRSDGTLLSCDMSIRNGLNDPEAGCMILVRRSVDLSQHTGTHVALNRLLHIPSSIATDLADAIRYANNAGEVAVQCKKTSDLVVSLLENGTSSISIGYMISTITDLATQRLIEIGIKEIGEPPVTFAFMALGSHGRRSQTLYSDQDNAICYQLTGEEDEKEVHTYFRKLATIVCDGLELAGYKKCVGDMIASNPQWCQPVSVWKKYFSEWIRKSEPEEIVKFSIMFDFRPAYGNTALTTELRNFIYAEIGNDAFFLTRIAQNALRFKTPMRLFGTIVPSGSKGIDVKRPAIAIVGFARLYALKNSISETNTILQLDAIKSLGIILESKHRNIVTAYEALFRLRLWNQAKAIEYNEKMDNYIETSQLGEMEEVILRECFKEIDKLQGLIQSDFLI